jgi:very-short-patch-repair endonuclease/predicted transcriptional regulator of viral defense system
MLPHHRSVGCESHAYGAFDSPHSADREVQALAGRQHGIVKSGQVRAAGLSRQAIRRRVEAGWLVPQYHGVYAVGHTALTGKSHLIAAVYTGGEEALASYRAGGELWGIMRGSQPIEVTGPRSRVQGKRFILHRSRLIHEEDRALIDNIPVTSLARTLVDLADVLPEKQLANAVHEAEVKRLFDLTQVQRVLDRLPGRKGRHKLRRVLSAYSDVQPFTRSRGERLVLEMCKHHGLTQPRTNTWIESHEVDFHWPEAGLVLEFDGGAVHRTTKAFYDDRKRDRALAAQGIHVVRATDRDDPAALAKELEQILSIHTHR